MKEISKRQKYIIKIVIGTIVTTFIILIATNRIIGENILFEKRKVANGSASSSTLLPEYIKDGITLGGVTGTLKNLDTSDATAVAEDIEWGKTAYVNGIKIIGTRARSLMELYKAGELKIGSYINYIPDTAEAVTYTAAQSEYTETTYNQVEGLTWQVMNIDEETGTVDITISADKVSSMPYTYLQGSTGYNNGVYLLDDLAKRQYSNSKLGTEARSIDIEDLEKHKTEEWLAAKNASIASYNADGKKTYTGIYSYYPNLYVQENGSGINTTTTKTNGINESDLYYTDFTSETYSQATTSGLTATQTYYGWSDTPTTYIDNTDFYSLIFGTGTYYWLASRYVMTDSNDRYAGFGLRYVHLFDIYGSYLFGSNCDAKGGHGRLRPVVSLGSEIQIGEGTGEATNAFQIVNQ